MKLFKKFYAEMNNEGYCEWPDGSYLDFKNLNTNIPKRKQKRYIIKYKSRNPKKMGAWREISVYDVLYFNQNNNFLICGM